MQHPEYKQAHNYVVSYYHHAHFSYFKAVALLDLHVSKYYFPYIWFNKMAFLEIFPSQSLTLSQTSHRKNPSNLPVFGSTSAGKCGGGLPGVKCSLLYVISGVRGCTWCGCCTTGTLLDCEKNKKKSVWKDAALTEQSSTNIKESIQKHSTPRLK